MILPTRTCCFLSCTSSRVRAKNPKVVFLGDGEFDGTALQATLHEAGWSYACRTAMSTTAMWDGTMFRLDTLGAYLKPGRLIELKDVHVTREVYGPIMVLCCWAKGLTFPYRDFSEYACGLADDTP